MKYLFAVSTGWQSSRSMQRDVQFCFILHVPWKWTKDKLTRMLNWSCKGEWTGQWLDGLYSVFSAGSRKSRVPGSASFGSCTAIRTSRPNIWFCTFGDCGLMYQERGKFFSTWVVQVLLKFQLADSFACEWVSDQHAGWLNDRSRNTVLGLCHCPHTWLAKPKGLPHLSSQHSVCFNLWKPLPINCIELPLPRFISLMCKINQCFHKPELALWVWSYWVIWNEIEIAYWSQ